MQKDDVLEVAANLDDAPRGIDGQPMHFNKENATQILGEHGKRQIEVFEQLQSNFNDKQVSSHFIDWLFDAKKALKWRNVANAEMQLFYAFTTW